MKAEVFSSEEIFDHFYDKYLRIIWMTACAKMYNRHVFDKLRFQKGALHEDEILFIPSIEAAKTVAVIDAKLYYYFMSDNSIMRSGLNEKRFIALDIMRDRCTYFANRPEQQLLAEMYYHNMFLSFSLATKIYYKEYKNIFKKHEMYMKKNFKKVLKNNKYCNMYKIVFFLTFVNIKLAEKLCNKYFPEITLPYE